MLSRADVADYSDYAHAASRRDPIKESGRSAAALVLLAMLSPCGLISPAAVALPFVGTHLGPGCTQVAAEATAELLNVRKGTLHA